MEADRPEANKRRKLVASMETDSDDDDMKGDDQVSSTPVTFSFLRCWR